MKEISTHDPPSNSKRLPISPHPSHSFRIKFPPRHHYLVLTIENARGARSAPLRMCQGENVWDLVLFPLLCSSSLSFPVIFTLSVYNDIIITTPHINEDCDLFVPRVIKQSKFKLVDWPHIWSSFCSALIYWNRLDSSSLASWINNHLTRQGALLDIFKEISFI